MKKRQAKRVMTALTIYRRSTLRRASNRLCLHTQPHVALTARMAFVLLWREPILLWSRPILLREPGPGPEPERTALTRRRARAVARSQPYRQLRRDFRRWLKKPKSKRESFEDFCCEKQLVLEAETLAEIPA